MTAAKLKIEDLECDLALDDLAAIHGGYATMPMIVPGPLLPYGGPGPADGPGYGPARSPEVPGWFEDLSRKHGVSLDPGALVDKYWPKTPGLAD